LRIVEELWGGADKNVWGGPHKNAPHTALVAMLCLTSILVVCGVSSHTATGQTPADEHVLAAGRTGVPERLPASRQAEAPERISETGQVEVQDLAPAASQAGPQASLVATPTTAEYLEVENGRLFYEVFGDLDMPGILDIAGRIEKEVSGSKKVVIKGAAHSVNMEKPEKFNKVVLEFLGNR
jgi:hypothetical protein